MWKETNMRMLVLAMAATTLCAAPTTGEVITGDANLNDLVDLPLMNRAGLAVAVADAVPEVLAAAQWVTSLPGGRGAVREVCDLLLKAQGKWGKL